jgi:hypothetical protein
MKMILVVLAVLAIFIATWYLTRENTIAAILGTKHTPPPTVPITDPTDPAQRSAVLAYARSLTFAYDKRDSPVARTFHSGSLDSGKADPYGPNGEYHGQFDQNLLDTFGDSGTVAPELNIHRSSANDLREGRVQLRIDIVPGPGRAAKDVFAAVGFYPGTSYLWVDRLGPKGDTARAVVVPADTTLPIIVREIRVYRTPHWNLAVARWTPATCWSCASEGWCH